MPLPELIEIEPLKAPVRAEITVPGSKSITNRSLILAALAKGETILRGALWSEDTQVMVDCLGKLGFAVKVEADPDEFCNRTIAVSGLGGKIPNAGTEAAPLELFVGNAGTAARFLAAMVCLGHGVYKLSGVPRMHERPQAALFQALWQLGYSIDSENDKLPAIIYGEGPKEDKCVVSIEESSQFASALLLSAKVGGWQVIVEGDNSEESPYVVMTEELLRSFPKKGGTFQIEPDASSGSYFWAAEKIIEAPEFMEFSEKLGTEIQARIIKPVMIANWPASGLQIDEEFPWILGFMPILQDLVGSKSKLKDFPTEDKFLKKLLRGIQLSDKPGISRKRDLGDSIMTAIVIAPFEKNPIRFTDLGRLRLQECERVAALRTELTKCGAKVTEEGDTLTVFPSQLHGAEIETYDDHRMAMCFAILGLKVPGIKLKNPSCVKKTFPNFFQKLAAAPPSGLGAVIRDAKTGKVLSREELFAE